MIKSGEAIFGTSICSLSVGNKYELKEHTQKVVKRCIELAERLNADMGEEIDFPLLIDAAWLHDVKKLNNRKDGNHHLPRYVRDIIKNANGESVNDDLLEIIAHHKGDFKPVRHPIESAILRLCDKIDKLRQATQKKKKKREKEFNKAKKNCKDTLKLFKQYGFDKNEMDVFKDFCKKYREKYSKKL